jgi:nicotinamidase-related amidase
MKRLLLVIDYQNDFVKTDGLLTAGEPAQAIESALLQRIDAYLAARADVICTLDTHAPEAWESGHPESAASALHCAEDTSGWQLYGKLAKRDLETLTKNSYVLDYADIDWLVRQYDVIELSGVSTDIGVLQNAIGLYNHAANQGLKVRFQVSSDCVASLDQATHLWALDYMQRLLGFTVLETAAAPL